MDSLITAGEDEIKAEHKMVSYLCFCCIHFSEMIMSEIGLIPNAFSPAVEVESWCCVGGEE